MYVCNISPSRSSTHAREDGGGVTRERTCAIRSSSRVGWMAEVRLKETEERLQYLQQCVPVSKPDQTPGPSLATVRKSDMLFTARGIFLRTLRITSILWVLHFPLKESALYHSLQSRPP